MSGLLKLVKILPQTKIESLGCAASAQAFAFLSAPADTPHASPLAVLMVTLFRSTSSGARSRPRRSTSRARGSASRQPSSSRAASRRMASSRSSSAPPAPRAFAFVSAPLDTHDASPSPSCSSLAVWARTTSPMTAKTCQACSSSWKSSHRRRSKASGAPPAPTSVRFCVSAP